MVDTVFAGGVEVQGKVYPKVISNIEGVNNFLLRSGFTSPYSLILRNTGNIDALGVSAYICAPDEMEITINSKKFQELIDVTESFDFYCSEFDRSYSIPNTEIIDLMTAMDYDFIPVDSVYEKPYKGKAYHIYVPKIAAGATVKIPFKVKSNAPNNHRSELISAVNTPNFFNTSSAGDTISEGLVDRLNALVYYYISALDPSILQSATDIDTWTKTWDVADAIVRKMLADDRDRKGYKATAPDGLLDDNYYDYGILKKQEATLVLLLEAIAKENSIEQRPDGILNFAGSQPVNTQSSPLISLRGSDEESKKQLDAGLNLLYNNIVIEFFDWLMGKAPLSGGAASEGLNSAKVSTYWAKRTVDKLNRHIDIIGQNGNGSGDANHTTTNTGISWDPNDITGPAGVGDERYIAASQAMNYVIRFENKAEAGLPAVFVNVYDTLDANRFDLETFELSSVMIGDAVLEIPAGRSSYIMEYDMRPSNNCIVKISAKLDRETGIAHWQMITLDPATGDLPDDVTAGFLPPNISAPEGEGSVSFRVRLKDNLAHREQVSNRANIIFDYNEPILTNTWTNTLDIAR
ncbi:MAG: hypothetical protein LBL33_10710, partial [Tannerella sp.]|nr:hypothetical protein [Tannerella sp.]